MKKERYIVVSGLGNVCFRGKSFRSVERAIKYSQKHLPWWAANSMSYYVQGVL